MAKIETKSTAVTIAANGALLSGDLRLPPLARGMVLFAHGSGSSRFSPRNRFVAEELDRHGLATLLVDLLTPSEEEIDETSGALRFDIPFLAGRLEAVSDWVKAQPEIRKLPLGYFGASTGAAAALIAAAGRPREIFAVVSRGGRPDLALEVLSRVRTPTLLIVGGDDREVLAMNEAASSLMKGERRLEIVPGATHLFEERGAQEAVAGMAADWFVGHLSGPAGLGARRRRTNGGHSIRRSSARGDVPLRHLQA